jgi:hypothetical protein
MSFVTAKDIPLLVMFLFEQSIIYYSLHNILYSQIFDIVILNKVLLLNQFLLQSINTVMFVESWKIAGYLYCGHSLNRVLSE